MIAILQISQLFIWDESVLPQSIPSNEQLQQTREELREDMNNGKSIKQQLKESTRLSAGILFKAGSSQLGKTVFDVHLENIAEKNKKEIEKIKKDEITYNDQVQKAAEVFQKKSTLGLMTIHKLTIICKPLKRKEDGKMPNKKDELILKYKEWSGRPAPSFDINHLLQDVHESAHTDIAIDNRSHNDDVGNNETQNIEITAL